MRRVSLVLAVALGAALPLVGGAPARASRPPAIDEIGASCEDCHAELVARYRGTPMARALGPVREGELAGLEPVVDLPAGWRYRFDEHGRIVEERTDDPDHRLAVPLAFAIGAGVLDRAYVAERGGRGWFAPLEQLSAHGDVERHAALAPGHAMRSGRRFSTPITAECLACHTDALPTEGFPRNRLAPPSEWSPRGLDCVACHADAEAHVAWRQAELEGAEPAGADPVGGARGSQVERMSVCARCHLQGDARIELVGRGARLPEPRGDLLDVRAVYLAAAETDEIGFVSQTERLVESACFLESGGALSCETCHDPHLAVADERERTRAACGLCHAGVAEHGRTPSRMDAGACARVADERGARDCVDCHMRRTPVFDVGGVRIHDHRIERVPPGPSTIEALRTFQTTDGRLRRFLWPGEPAPAHADDPGLELLAQFNSRNFDEAAALARRELGPTSKRMPMAHHVLGLVHEITGDLPEARRAYLRALLLDPELADSAVNLALVEGTLGDPAAGIARLDALLARHPDADSALRNRAVLRARLGDLDGMRADLEAAFARLPDAALARALASHWATRDPRQAERWRREARRLDPTLPLD